MINDYSATTVNYRNIKYWPFLTKKIRVHDGHGLENSEIIWF